MVILNLFLIVLLMAKLSQVSHVSVKLSTYGKAFKVLTWWALLMWMRHLFMVIDHKLTSRYDPERYFNSWQWRAYLTITGKDKFRYQVFECSDIKETR